MATIALYPTYINQMPSMLESLKKTVKDYKDNLELIHKKALMIDTRICDMNEVLTSLQSCTQTQEEMEATIDRIKEDHQQFITDVTTIDQNVSDLITKEKEDFYKKYAYLKPDSENWGLDSFKDFWTDACQ